MKAFKNRTEAGRALGATLAASYVLQQDSPPLVLGLPRGGIPVAVQVAKALKAPLDVLVVRKLGVPGHEELAMGAVAGGGLIVLNEPVIDTLGISDEEVDQAVTRELREVARREAIYRDDTQPFDVFGRQIFVVDDGLATGSTMIAAVRALQRARPAKIVVAIPVAPLEAVQALRREADEVICLATPEPFFGVGNWYEEFTQVSDDEVREWLGGRHGFLGDDPTHKRSDPGERHGWQP